MIRRARDRDDLRERVFEFYGLMDTAVSIGEGLEIVQRLNPSIAASFREQLRAAVAGCRRLRQAASCSWLPPLSSWRSRSCSPCPAPA
jgi:hypothetical protein